MSLLCLSKLNQCLEPAVFTGWLRKQWKSALYQTINTIQKASKLITKDRHVPMDGQLFLIKHLLILREQIAPFDIECSVTHKELDFSHLLVTAVKVSLYSAGQNQKVDSVIGKPLKKQAFATPDKVTELVQKINTAIQQELPPLMMN